MSEKLLIIDGHSVAYRAFYALPTDRFQTSTGQHTNAVYGFISMLVKLLADERPTHIAVAFDVSRHSFRTDLYPDYKGTRDASPEEFRGQVELIRSVLSAMGIVCLTKDSYEADDILATLAYKASAEGYTVLVASGDRDSFQMINDHVTVLYPGQGPGDLRKMTPQSIEEKYNVPPSRYPEIAALVGETSDNLPGVPGVGPKTAAQWINKFDGLDNLLKNADSIKGKRGEALREHVDDVRRNRRLNRLLTDLDIGIPICELTRKVTDRQAVESIFDALEFSSLRPRVWNVANIALEHTNVEETITPVRDLADDHKPLEISTLTTGCTVEEWLQKIHEGAPIGLWLDGVMRPAQGNAEIVALSDGERALVIDTVDLAPHDELVFAQWVSKYPCFVMHDGKGVFHALRGRGWTSHLPEFDVQLAAYLLHPEQRDHSFETLIRRYLPGDYRDDESQENNALFKIEEITSSNPPAACLRAADCATQLLKLRAVLHEELEDHSALALLTEIELPVQGVVRDMEAWGIAVDEAVLEDLHDTFTSAVEHAAQGAYDAIGRSVNLSSPKQLQDVLFDQLGMPKTKKTKTGYTTNAEALQNLYAKTEHPFLAHLLEHRDKIKLLQMVDTLRAARGGNGRIHTTFSQVVTATGRLASSDPNLQNIPARSVEGLRIRHAFVAGDEYEALMSADYSQIEMRIMAHLSRDRGLIDAFNSGEDLHRTMAAMVFAKPVDEVTSDDRNHIKATSYGLAYGLSSYGLSQQLGISVPDASVLRDKYFERFGGVRDYLAQLVSQAIRDGYTQTMFKRRRYLPDLRSANRQRREMAERAALNAPIQGSAADIIKIAMINVAEALDKAGLQSRILLQIHDELIVEVAAGECEQVEKIIREQMASPVHMDVPLEVAIGIGNSWMEAAH